MSQVAISIQSRSVSARLSARHTVRADFTRSVVAVLNVPAVRGPIGVQGNPGPPGPTGPAGDGSDVPDLVLLFENKLI